jgi:hypothetical protein
MLRQNHYAILKKLAKNAEEIKLDVSLPNLACLAGMDVISARVSDHHPIVHDGVLFWNVMMQGDIRKNKQGYNNGFGIIETDKQYSVRLIKIACVIAEIINTNPSIDAIGLCEGPIQANNLFLFEALKIFICMQRFTKQIYKPQIKTAKDWGLIMLADECYEIKSIQCDLIDKLNISEPLANRFQLWELEKNGRKKYFGLGHFPFGGDECANEKAVLSKQGAAYSRFTHQLLAKYKHDYLILCADFNLNPYLINQEKDRIMDQVPSHNSILLPHEVKATNAMVKSVTVDGILLSQCEKQKYFSSQAYTGLFSSLKLQRNLFKTYLQEQSEKQGGYEECVALTR